MNKKIEELKKDIGILEKSCKDVEVDVWFDWNNYEVAYYADCDLLDRLRRELKRKQEELNECLKELLV